jgi:predicted dehydrogenase/threonine dehydrogenase-like Zn-dependent dehydrogenase
MKQILQYLGNGETILAEVPCPKRSGGSLLCETKTTLVSLGTEKMLIDFGKGSLLAKARAQPDKVKQVLQKIKTDGLKTTIDTVKAKLDSPIQLGYCNVGTVLESDPQSKFQKGDRVVNNGPHAEFVNVAENLAAKIPDNVTDEAAAFTVVGAIGLQGVRLLKPTLGEKIVVSGLGLIGLLTVQILKANGCQVLGIDFDPKKLELARQFGAETVDLGQGQDPVRIAEHWTNGVGVDGIVITASTKSDQLIHQAASMCRKRARIILVGVIGLNLQRADFYEKELSFQVSCSYGPGRYEDSYERKGMDYPIGFVRWTEQRNFEAILELLAGGKIDVSPLITHRFNFDDALTGYQAVDEPGAMGILLNYGTDNGQPCQIEDANANELTACNTSDQEISNFSNVRIAFVGAGGFTTRMLLPLLPKQNVTLDTIVSSTGVSAAHAAKKFGFASAESDSSLVWNNRDINTVFITTPHNSHAKLVCDALAAGKHVFVEKPLALTHDELNQVVEKIENAPKQLLMIGFNRRFSPHTQKIKKWLAGTPGPKGIVITMNAGAIPANHWTQNLEVGGGRINGEACHLIDLARYLADAPILSTSVNTMVSGDGSLGDCVAINLSFEDGSIATIHYLANGSKDFPKERFEVFAGGKVAVCDNFRSSRLVGSKEKFKTRGQDKGHAAELKAFVDAIHNGTTPPIPVSELIEVTRSTLDAASAVHQAVNKSR